MTITRPVVGASLSNRALQAVAVFVVSALGLSRADAVDLAQTIYFNIPAQELSAALIQFSQQARIQVVISEDLTGRKTDGVTGTCSIKQALTQLLASTGLMYQPAGDTSITIGKADPRATSVERRHLRVAEQSDAARPDSRAAASPVVPSPLEASQASEEIREVIVIGSRLKHAEQEGPSPVLVITREDIDRSGAATMREMLNTVSQNAASPDESGNAAFLGASTIQLRGLPVGTTLVLLNGRRVGASGAQVASNFFDLNNIPLAAVERIEVLTGSASAIYGADALGGAVNVILKNDFAGADAAVRFGTSAEGDATERNASLAVGTRGEAFSGMLLLDYFDRDPLRGTDRNLTSTQDFTRFGGQDLRSTLAYPANVYSLDFDAAGNARPLPGLHSPFAGVPAGTNGIGLTPANFAATDGVLNRFDGARFTTLVAEADRKSAFASGRYEFSPAISIFGEALYTHREQIVQLPPDALFLGQLGLFAVPANNPFNPFGVPVGVDYRFVEVGARVNDSTTDFSRFVVGLEGSLFDRFDWQVYLLGDRDKTEVFNQGSVNAFLNVDLVQQFLNSTDPAVALNVFSTTGNNNPSTLAAILDVTQTTDDLSTRASMGEAIIRGPLFDLPAGPLSGVVGVNVRREKVAFLSPLAGDLRDTRDSKAVFAEISVPLVSPAQQVPALRSLELSAAVRYDDYDQIGSSTNPQFGLTWRPLASLLLRASYGEAFKAPTAFDLFFPRLSFTSTALDPARGNTPSEFILIRGGNPQLAPEIGQSLNAGLRWEPAFVPGFSVDLNAFRLRQEDFITVLDADLILTHPELFTHRIVRAAPSPTDPPGFAGKLISVDSSNVNFGRLTVRGADVQLQYAFPATRYGRFVSTLSGTYVDEYKILVTPGTEALNEVGHANQSGYPVRFRGSAGLSWSAVTGWSASLTARYQSSYTDYDGVNELPSQTLFDLQTGYHFGGQGALSLLHDLDTTLGVVNLTDEQGSYSNSSFGYDSQRADIRGRFYYLSLQRSF